MVLTFTYATVIISAVVSSTFDGDTAFAFAIDARRPSPAASSHGSQYTISSLTGIGRRFPSVHLERNGISIVGRGGAQHLSASKDDIIITTSPREEALSSMKTCYKTVFAAVVVDNLMPGVDVRDGWKIMLASRPSSWLDVAYAVSSMNLVAFGLGLWWVTKLYEKIGSSASNNTDGKEGTVAAVDMSVVTNVMSTYRFMYLATAWSVVGLCMRLADKVFVSNTIAPFVVLALAVGTSIYVQTSFFTSEANILNSNKKDNPAMMNGIEAARNMSFCAVSFLFFAVLRFAFWAMVVVPSDLALPIKILQINKFLSFLALSKLLQSLDRRFLDATMELTKVGNIEKQQGGADVFRALKEAEKSFYAKVAKVFRASIILDTLRYVVPIMIKVVKNSG
jgi:galactitol-specific phosphotransferase system IIB component